MKKLLTIAVALLTSATAMAEVIDGISYRLSKTTSGNTAYVQKDNNVSYSGVIVIPETVTSNDGETYTVVGIDYRAMMDISMVTSLSLPATIKSIASYNFLLKNMLESIIVAEGNPYYDSRNGCNAIIETRENILILGSKNTVIPEGVTAIGESAFGGTALTTVTIPKTCTCINEGAFSGCHQLTTLTILGELTEGIDENAFSGCDALTDIYCYATTPPDLDSETFGEDGINGVTLHVPAAAIDAYKENRRWSKISDDIVPLADADLKGDVNDDGKVDIADLAAVIAHMLNQPVEKFNEEAADIDGNGTIDLTDVEAIINLILLKAS